MQLSKRLTRQQVAHATIYVCVIGTILYGIFTLDTQTPKTQATKPIAVSTTTTTSTTTTSVPPTTTATIPAVATETPVAVQSESSCSLVDSYDWPVQVAYGVCMAESGGNTNAVNMNDDHGKCRGSYSLMQAACFWYPFFGYEISFDPHINMEIAYKIWERSGGSFRQWTTCKKVRGCA